MQFGSSNGVSIDLAASQSSANSISTIVGEMKGILGQIRTSAGTGQSTWSGQAAIAFGNTHNNWQDVATRLNTALNEIEANLTTSFKGYDSQDSEVASAVTQSVGTSTLKL
ncbi:WXG100 family type VII secretion target [Gordonia pseudamarae]|jgi:WXG100 family type VII secretion target|uniref:ESAT-6-like protein n=1 Tax=Gordonia pseudamarae TaxID=2831662 RepID=A0ABX6IKC3_9ACTN|nr:MULTISPECIES: WXG100 family type VII secretion target [Gordonia]MBD0022772.1 WXG100 family type VII secretion target [Gordonia sp. (in: high G+C Gram-positive bacteria)]QHN27371.1 WXG100 family type VII secretion target [Gordonia pseudamarae]QHN36255.1 WXG100 family type VII secretion target [Gordonia pseudamarae]